MTWISGDEGHNRGMASWFFLYIGCLVPGICAAGLWCARDFCISRFRFLSFVYFFLQLLTIESCRQSRLLPISKKTQWEFTLLLLTQQIAGLLDCFHNELLGPNTSTHPKYRYLPKRLERRHFSILAFQYSRSFRPKPLPSFPHI